MLPGASKVGTRVPVQRSAGGADRVSRVRRSGSGGSKSWQGIHWKVHLEHLALPECVEGRRISDLEFALASEAGLIGPNTVLRNGTDG